MDDDDKDLGETGLLLNMDGYKKSGYDIML